MIIQKIFAQEIFNAQGYPTIQCTIQLEHGQVIKSSIPAGFAAPAHAVAYTYDTDNRIVQQRMQTSIKYINDVIVPLLIRQPINALAMDSKLMDLHVQHEGLGGNTTLVVSLALFKAQAIAEGSELYELIQSISGTCALFIPKPLTSLFEFRQGNILPDIKELLVAAPIDQLSFQQQFHSLVTLHHHAKAVLENKGYSIATGQYGSFMPSLHSLDEAFTLAAEITKTIPNQQFLYGLNIDADDLYDPATQTYRWNHHMTTSTGLIDSYMQLHEKYPACIYLQDPLATSDSSGWAQMHHTLPITLQIAGDKIFGTNPMKIRWGILKKIANMVVIRPEYISTISQTLAAIDACKNNNKPFLIAGDSMGTHDSFISDLAVGTGASYIKAGAPNGSEHMTKYNRLLEIERHMLS